MAFEGEGDGEVRLDVGFMTRAVDEVKAALQGLNGPMLDSASVLERAFQRSFDGLERQIQRTARTGEFSFRGMVDSIIADLGRIAIQTFVTAPLKGLVEGLFDFGGARAVGGPVSAGRSYLVGERGPELFTPAGHGAIAPHGSFGGRGPAVVFNVQARDAASFTRSESQIAALMSRALARGARTG